MSMTGFVSSFTGSPVGPSSVRTPCQSTCHRTSNLSGLVMVDKSGKTGFFGRIKQSILKPLVTVPGGGNDGDVLECVFCKGTGICDCDACKGTGKDAIGTCFMCDGKTYLTCTVCVGIGSVDRIRRGGTDDRKQFVIKKKKS